MWKSLLAGAGALALIGTSSLYAQQGPAPGNPANPGGERHFGFSAEDRGAFLDARIAALKAGLKLTADQEKSWPAFEQAYRDVLKLRGEQRRQRFQDRDRSENANPVDRLDRRAAAVTARGAALKRLADAERPLYQSLDDAQKGRFQLLSRMGERRHHEHFAWREHNWRGEER
jgi:zinc resistance-associated protein